MATYLVVGASSGIGACIQSLLQQEGNRVITISRRANESSDLHISADILQDELPKIDEVIDGIVYCPGSILLKPFRGLKLTDFKSDWDINVGGAIKVLQQYTPNLQSSTHPSVVLFSTVAVSIGMPFHSSIAAAKGAVEGLVKSLAAEWAPKIRVNAIAPSLTDTPLAGKLLDTEAKRTASADRHPLKTVGKPEDIAQLAHFLLSEKSAFMTGQTLHIDGGISSVKV